METNLKDSIVEEVVQKMLSRSRVGIEKYGVTLDREDLTISQWITHAQEEALDLSLYLTRLKRIVEYGDNNTLELQNKFDELVRECINQKHELATKERIIENLNKVIKSQEDEIKELNKSTHIAQKRRAWHV